MEELHQLLQEPKIRSWLAVLELEVTMNDNTNRNSLSNNLNNHDNDKKNNKNNNNTSSNLNQVMTISISKR